MKPASAYVLRLQQAITGVQRLTEADIIREIQQEAYQDGYAKAAQHLMGIALESQERTDTLVKHADVIASRALEH